MVLQIPSRANSEEGQHVAPSAVALAGSEVVHAALTAVLLGAGSWVIGFAVSAAPGSRADGVEIVGRVPDIGWVIDFVETSVGSVPGIGWAVGFVVGLAVVLVAGEVRHVLTAMLLGTGIGWVIGAASVGQPADSALVLVGAGIGSSVAVEASEAWHAAGVGSEASSGALLAAGRYFLEMRLHSKSAFADARTLLVPASQAAPQQARRQSCRRQRWHLQRYRTLGPRFPRSASAPVSGVWASAGPHLGPQHTSRSGASAGFARADLSTKWHTRDPFAKLL